jgi:hypothetical protein
MDTPSNETTLDLPADPAPADPVAEENITPENAPADPVADEFDFVMEGLPDYADLATEYKTAAKAIGMTAEQAKELAAVGVKLSQRIMDEADQRKIEQVQNWEDTVRNDKEIGGPQLDANMSIVKKALETFGTPELKTYLIESGIGSHPELIKAFYRVGKAISEDSLVGGLRPAAPQQKSMAQQLFPNMNP